MSSVLAPKYKLTLGTQQWTDQLLRVELSLAAAPLIDCLEVRLPSSASPSAETGDPVELSIDSGEDEEAVFTGAIGAIQRGFDYISVTALNAGGALAQVRPAVTYEQITAGSVVRSLCDDAGVDVGDLADGVSLVYYAADPGRTALEHIARVCGWSGAMARVSADNRVESVVVNATQAELALLYGREVISFESRKLPAPLASFTVAGESAASDSSAPEASRPTTDFFAGNRPAGPAADSRWQSEPALRTAEAAGTAGAALQRIYNSSRERGGLKAWLQPKLRPGTIIEVQSLPDGMISGPLWVYRVRHTMSRRGAVTQASFYKGGDSFDPSALLGSALSAIGGLL